MDTSKVAGKLANEILRFMKKHKRGIMTTSAIVGVGLTAYTAIRGTVDAQEKIDYEELTDDEFSELPIKEKAKIIGVSYVPMALAVGGTSAAIIGLHVSSNKTIKTLAGAAVTLQTLLNEYQNAAKEEKVDDVIRKNLMEKEAVKNQSPTDRLLSQEVRDSIRDRADGTDDNEVRCFYEDHIGMFEATNGEIRDAENAINRFFGYTGYVSINDFFQELGINKIIEGGDALGWSTDIAEKRGYDCIKTDHKLVHMDDGSEWIYLQFVNQPEKDVNTYI